MSNAIQRYDARDFRKALTTNSSDSSFTSKIATTTEPTNDGVIDLPLVIGYVPRKLLLLPYGLGSDNDAFSMKVIGWASITNTLGTLWVPVPLIQVSCTISGSVGIASSPVLNTERFADTITLTDWFTPDIDAYEVDSPTGDVNGHIVLDTKGFKKIEWIFDQTTGTPTMNCLWKVH